MMNNNVIVITVVVVALLTFIPMLLNNEASSTISQDDIYVLQDGVQHVKDLSNFVTSCYMKTNTDPSALADCKPVTSAFNLKMEELKEEYGTTINETISK